MENDKKIMINFTSVIKPIEVVDNNSNHTPTSSGETYRIASSAHNKESCNSLTSKVNQVVPNLINPTRGLEENVVYKTKIVTSSGVQEFKFGIKNNNGQYSLTGTAVDQNIVILLPRSLLKKNAYSEYADTIRAVYLLMLRCFNLPFQSAVIEERGFKKLIKKLWP